MINKLILGTANFAMPYGILSEGHYLSYREVSHILDEAHLKGVQTFDTAYAYGESVQILENYFAHHKKQKINIVNKISIKDNYDDLIHKLKEFLQKSTIQSFDALLIHDPFDLQNVDKNKVSAFFETILSEKIANKIGVSVYKLQEVKDMQNIFPISVVQCPVNILNQTFLKEDVLDYFEKQNIEIHARSLFLQGVLLSDVVPKHLSSLKLYCDEIKKRADEMGVSRLSFLMTWANQLKHIKKWVLGVSSLSNFNEIIECASCLREKLNCNLDKFKCIEDPLVDPRNWNK